MLVQVKASYYQNELNDLVERCERWSQFLLKSPFDWARIEALDNNLENVSFGC